MRKKIQFDIVQIPYSVFDRRFEPFLPELKSRGVTIFVRSVFLQGLVFLDPNRLTGRLTKAAEPLRRLHAIAEEQRIAVDAICLNFPLLNPLVDKVIIGVDGLTQLKKNVQALAEVAKLKLATNALINVNCSDEDVILPQRWK